MGYKDAGVGEGEGRNWGVRSSGILFEPRNRALSRAELGDSGSALIKIIPDTISHEKDAKLY